MNRISNLALGSLMCMMCACSSLEKFFDVGQDDTSTRQEEIQASAEKTEKPGDRSPASLSQNPLRVTQYCAVDNFSRVVDCYPTLDLCQRAARGFAMCSGR